LSELFIKNAVKFFASSISRKYPDIAEKTFQEKASYQTAFFIQWTSRSHHIGIVVAHSQYTNTASWATASPLQQSQLVNNPD
jgi:hypothetical protein